MSSKPASWRDRWVGRFQGEALFAGASLLAPLIGFAGNLIAARHVGPEPMGVIQAAALVPAYLYFLHGGVFSGFQRNLPLYRGRGDTAKVQRMTDASWTTARVVAGLGALFALVFAAWFAWMGQTQLHLWSALATVAVVVAAPLAMHIDVVYRSSGQHARAARVMMWGNLVALAVCALPAVWGAVGNVVRLALTAVSATLVRLRWNPLPARAPGEWAEIVELARIGLPNLIATQLYTLLTVADRSVAASFLSQRELGHFTLASMVTSGLHLIPGVLGMLITPRVAHRYGATGQAAALRREFWIGLGAMSAAIVPSALGAYWLLGPLARHWLPKYVEGLPAAEIACATALGFVYLGVTPVISTLHRLGPYLVAVGISLGLVWIAGGWVARQGYGIEGVALVRCIATLLLAVFVLVYTWWLTRPST